MFTRSSSTASKWLKKGWKFTFLEHFLSTNPSLIDPLLYTFRMRYMRWNCPKNVLKTNTFVPFCHFSRIAQKIFLKIYTSVPLSTFLYESKAVDGKWGDIKSIANVAYCFGWMFRLLRCNMKDRVKNEVDRKNIQCRGSGKKQGTLGACALHGQ